MNTTNLDPSLPLKIAVMSFAHVHAESYIRLLQAYDGIEVLTCDWGPHPEGELRGRAFADLLGADYVDSYEELLAWGPDGVIVTSENARHREHVELAAKAGAAILCEKPLATSAEDGLAIRQAVIAAGVTLMVAFPVRFASTFQRLKASYDAGQLGQIVSVRGSNNGKLPLERSWFADASLSGGGALVDHIVHIADLLDGLMESAPVTVTAVANSLLHADRAQAETAGLVTITYDNGTIAAIDCSWSQPESAPTWGGLKLSVAGTGGIIDVNFFGPRVKGLVAETGLPIEMPYGPDFNEELLRTFLGGIRTATQPQPDLSVGLRTLSIVLAAQRSVATGRTVAVEQF